MMRRAVGLSLFVWILIFSACGDDSVAPPEEEFFTVQVTLRDAAGDPMPGVLMGLASDNPYLQDRKGDKAATRIEALIPRSCWVQLAILDINRDIVRLLVNGEWPAGQYTLNWNGTDDEGVLQDSGRYSAAMRAFDLETDELLFDGSVDMLMCILDPVRKHVGVTDEEGRIELYYDKRFPHRYDREPMTAYDENGEAIGPLEPTSTMVFTFADTIHGGGRTFRREVTGPMGLDFVWEESPAVVASPGEPIAVAPPNPAAESAFRLGPVYPNPFN
jgi:hypothetical protein